MPVASQQKDPQVVQYHHHLLPKPPYHHGHPHHPLVEGADGVCIPDDSSISDDLCLSHDDLWNVDSATLTHFLDDLSAGGLEQQSQQQQQQCHYISTHSPPIINLSPNLSPASTDHHRTSPVYDLRESTRRRSTQDHHPTASHPMQHSPQIIPGIIADDSGRKSESPSRKRRKTSASLLEFAASPSPPPLRPLVDVENVRERRRSTSQRRPASGAAPNSARARRSPGTRRRTRERQNSQRSTTESPERRAFQPPSYSGRQLHPAAVLAATSHQGHVIDIEQVTASAPVTVAPYAIPVCAGPHPVPVCSPTHMPPAWTFPGACGMTMQLPGCAMQHLPACTSLHMPLPHPMQPLLHPAASHPHPPSAHPLVAHNPHQHAGAAGHTLGQPPNQFPQRLSPQQEEEAQLLAEQQRTAYQQLASGFHQHHHHHHHPATSSIPTPPPVFLQEPLIHAAPPDIYHPFSRIYARRLANTRSRLRSSVPPPPPYPTGFLLQFLAMLGNPPMPPFGRDPDEATEQENYEALLNLAERLGEAKPRGLTKVEIEQLPAYRFNSEVRRSDLDQTSCVVCMCDFESRQLLRVLPCCHEFHAKCVDKWLKTNRTCPVCRADAAEVGTPSE